MQVVACHTWVIFVVAALFPLNVFSSDNSLDSLQARQEKLSQSGRSLATAKRRLLETKNKDEHPGLLMQIADLHIERSRILYILAREKHPKVISSLQDVPPATVEVQRAIDTYQRFLADHAQHADADKVTFFMAQEYSALSDDAEALRLYEKLIAHYPSSRYRDDARIILGDKAFSDKAFDRASDYYGDILKGPEGSSHALARYKLAWCEINLARCPSALELFEAAAKTAQPEAHNGDHLGREALTDSVLCFTQVKKPHEALSYYKSLSDSRLTYVAVLDKLAHRYAILNQPKFAVPIYRELAHTSFETQSRIEAFMYILGHQRSVGENQGLESDLEALAQLIPSYAYQWRIVDNERAETLASLEKYARDAITRWHVRARQNKDTPLKQDIARAYKAYHQAFPTSAKRRDMLANAAEAYFEAGQYLDAATTYVEASALGGSAQERYQRAHAALTAYVEALKAPKALSLFELMHARQAFITQGQRFLKDYPRSTLAADIRFGIAQAHYDGSEWDAAISALQEFIRHHSSHDKVGPTSRLLLHTFHMKEDLPGMVRMGQQLLASQQIRDPAVLRDIKDIVATAEFKKLSDRIETDRSSSSASSATMSGLFELSRRYKGTEAGEKSLYNLFVTARQRGDLPTMDASAKQLFNEYPKSEYVEKSLPFLALALIQSGAFEEGAATAAAFSARYPQAKASPDLQRQAALIRIHLGVPYAMNPTLRNSNLPDASQLLDTQARFSTHFERWTELKVVGGDLVRRGYLGQGYAAMARSAYEGRQFKDLIRVLEVSQKLPGSAPNEARTELLFLRAEVDFATYAAITPTSLGSEERALTEKTQRLERLERRYTQLAQTGRGPLVIAALAKVALAYQNFSQFLGQTSVPKGLTPNQVHAYRSAMREKRRELETTSRNLFATCQARAYSLSLYTPDTLACVHQRPTPRTAPPLLTTDTRAYASQMRPFTTKLLKDPKDLTALHALIRLHLNQGRLSLALLTALRALEVSPQDSDTHNLLGVCHARLGQDQDAYDRFSQVTRHQPHWAAATNLFKLCQKYGDNTCMKRAASKRSGGSSVSRSDIF